MRKLQYSLARKRYVLNYSKQNLKCQSLIRKSIPTKINMAFMTSFARKTPFTL